MTQHPRPVVGPFGVFPSIHAAAKALKCRPLKVRRWCERNTRGWRFVEPPQTEYR